MFTSVRDMEKLKLEMFGMLTRDFSHFSIKLFLIDDFLLYVNPSNNQRLSSRLMSDVEMICCS